ncbi:MAG: hypothetical protein DMD89_31120 [Candidatus Rokuibacteriota bacterium]|nr:MAG: hypothetical protein DMD89_31120 [Candidatus Rokubacteria bacterium]
MTARLSQPIESLINHTSPEPDFAKVSRKSIFAYVDVAIVGSGYGGSIAATRLAGDGRDVVILERGREYALGDFPVDLGHVPGHVRFHRADADDPVGYPDALFDIRVGKTMDVLVGSGLGGTSLINANVAARPHRADFRDEAWPYEIRTNPDDLDEGFEKASALLGVHTSDRQKTEKYGALSVLADALGEQCYRAPLTVTFAASGENAAGIAQPACTRCGNCVTGCNVGSKNTLMMNALPLAKARGANLFTGATVLSLMPSDIEPYPWIIRLRRTASEKTALRDEVFHLAARDVILAAGTLGSTEILKRSEALHDLKFSGELGTTFSGNGDAIAFGFAQRDRVHAVGEPTQDGSYEVGPTITGIVRTGVRDQDGKWQKLTIEDAAVPTSISSLFGELLTTGALLHRLDNPKLPKWYRTAKDADPVTVAPEAIDHSQILLVMGDDGAEGRLQLQPAKGQSPDRARLIVDWDSVGSNPALRAAHALLEKHDRAAGFDGGQYVPNPLWRLLPEKASSVMSGPAPGGRAITVHPLGGCRMGDDIRTGVVNHRGQVFKDVADGNGTEVHDGLHVLDGAIIPKALGINPFLTIAALSWRAAELLRESRGWAPPEEQAVSLSVNERGALAVQLPEPRMIQPAQPPVPEAVHLVLREQLIGTVTSVPEWLKAIPKTSRWAQDKGLILRVEMDVPDLERWLERGTQQPLRATAELHANPLPPDLTRREHRVHTREEDLGAATRVAEGCGTVRLLKPDDVGWLTRLLRTVRALRAYSVRRQSFRSLLAVPREHGDQRSLVSRWKELRGFWCIAWQQARYRRLQYRLQFTRGDKSFTLEGEKLLAWRVNAPRLWDALLNLEFTLSPASPADAPVKGKVEMDMTYLATTGTPQVKASPHLPATVVALSRLGLLFGRAILQTHFWEFGAPDYPDATIPRPVDRPRLKVGDKRPDPKIIELDVPLREGGDDIRLQLTRYPQVNPAAQPVLLIHGLAQGSLIYSTDTLETNMAAAMWQAGFDVWLLDYRLSNMLPYLVPQGGWSMDEIAQYDIPMAVERVYRESGGRPVSIFAHCVGATSVAMAILKGWLTAGPTENDRVKCVAFNAIHPWTMPSAVNEFRARFGSFFRDVLGRDLLDPIPAPSPSATQVLFDRLAFSVSRYAEEACDHCRSGDANHSATVCDRMTFLYGRMWRHANLDPRTHADLPKLMGPGAGDVYRQLYYFALHERLTDRDGVNTYLTEDNIRAHWKIPTFFFHGEESMVFNPQSAERSAIRLDAILKHSAMNSKPPVRLFRVPDFGHMDVVFGKDAHKKVYPVLAKFFANSEGPIESPLDPSHDLDARSGFRLTAGPVLRAAWIDEDKRIYIRLWAETNDEVTSLVDGVQLVAKDLKELKQWPVHGAERRYHVLDASTDQGGSTALSVGVKIGPGASQTAAPTEYDFSYDRLPWLQRLRNADVQRPCRDMRFLVGSCRYPGTPFEREASDAIFGGMRPHIEGATNGLPGVHMLFLVGDQIYADATANMLDSRAWRERYAQRYRVAFTSPNARKVLAHVPTHFAIDDHEISDNWSGEAVESPDYSRAVESARSFQSSGRETRVIDPSAKKRDGDALWYSLSEQREHCCPAFVMDTRSERAPRLYKRGPNFQLVSPQQLAALRDWLSSVNHGATAHMPKFIFCGVGIAPISREFAACGKTWRSQDWWPGYPDTLSDVLLMILKDQIQHVVFISGDLHLSSASRLTLRHEDANDVTAWQVVSSGLYAPMPFASAQLATYNWNQPVALPRDVRGDIELVAESGLLCSGRSHFLRLDAEHTDDRWTLSIGVVGSGAEGRFLDPAGTPPRGFEPDGPRWTVRLGSHRR